MYLCMLFGVFVSLFLSYFDLCAGLHGKNGRLITTVFGDFFDWDKTSALSNYSMHYDDRFAAFFFSGTISHSSHINKKQKAKSVRTVH